MKRSPIQEGSRSSKLKKPNYLKKNAGRTASESPYNRVKKHGFGVNEEEEEKDLSVIGKSTEASSIYKG